MKRIFFSTLALIGLTLPIMADGLSSNPVITAMPSLSIAPDAHAAGLGDIGTATNPDLNSQHWNPAKYAFMDSKGGITANYTPWLRKLVSDIDLAYIAGYYKFDDLQAISAGFTYFSMGEVDMVTIGGDVFAQARPNEWALDVAYSRKLHEYVSMAVALRFLYSDMNNGVNSSVTGDAQDMHAAWTMAADVSLYYKQPISLPMGESYFALGFNLSNLGGKMSYSADQSNFIPANMRLGVSYEMPFDNYNRLMATVECNKMLVPLYSENKFAKDANGNQLTGQALRDWYSALNPALGWAYSFCDSPGYTDVLDAKSKNHSASAALEEFQEVQWGVGLEYSYNRQFFGRIGYSYENWRKGNRNYLTLGAGFKLSIFSLDVAYCVATTGSNPLDQTMRFTLGFDLAGIKDLVNNKK